MSRLRCEAVLQKRVITKTDKNASSTAWSDVKKFRAQLIPLTPDMVLKDDKNQTLCDHQLNVTRGHFGPEDLSELKENAAIRVSSRRFRIYSVRCPDDRHYTVLMLEIKS